VRSVTFMAAWLVHQKCCHRIWIVLEDGSRSIVSKSIVSKNRLPRLPRALCLFIAAHRYVSGWRVVLMVATGCIHEIPEAEGRVA
jgi:hypothetical protein